MSDITVCTDDISTFPNIAESARRKKLSKAEKLAERENAYREHMKTLWHNACRGHMDDGMENGPMVQSTASPVRHTAPTLRRMGTSDGRELREAKTPTVRTAPTLRTDGGTGCNGDTPPVKIVVVNGPMETQVDARPGDALCMCGSEGTGDIIESHGQSINAASSEGLLLTADDGKQDQPGNSQDTPRGGWSKPKRTSSEEYEVVDDEEVENGNTTTRDKRGNEIAEKSEGGLHEPAKRWKDGYKRGMDALMGTASMTKNKNVALSTETIEAWRDEAVDYCRWLQLDVASRTKTE